MSKWLLAIIIFAGFLLRVVQLDKLPVGFTGDEAQQGYSAYSILKTGRDEWGDLLPLFPRGLGDYKPPLYTYITIPFVAILGLNEFAVRLPAALAGGFSVLAVYLLTSVLFNKKVALWAAILMAFNPWHIQLSRTAFEASLGVLLFSTGFLFYLKSKNNPRMLALSALFFGLNLYTYHAWRLFTVLFIAIIVAKEFVGRKNLKKLIIPGIIFLIFVLPILVNIPLALKRGDVSIFSSSKVAGYFKNKATSDLPQPLPRLIDNKILYTTGLFVDNYLSYFNPVFYFTGNRPDSTYLNFPRINLFYLPEIVFIGFALFLVITKKHKLNNLLLVWILLAPIPAAITDSLNAHRAVTLIPVVTIISAFGLTKFIDYIASFTRFKRHKYLPHVLVAGLIGIFFFSFLYTYLYQLTRFPIGNLRYGYKEAFTQAIALENEYDGIVFSRHFSMPQIFIAFYKKTDPVVMQQASQDWLRYEKAGRDYVDQIESYNLGKYEFKDIYLDKENKKGNYLYVAHPENFLPIMESVFEVKNPAGEVIYRAISIKKD